MSRRKPFQNLRPDEWLRLTLFALGTLYAVFTIWSILDGHLFTPLGGDFPAFYASAQIAATSGFANVYDLAVQREVQNALLSPYTSEATLLPAFLLPFFLLPFCLLLPLGLSGGLIVWTLINLVATVGYLFRFLRAAQRYHKDDWANQSHHVAPGQRVERSLLMLALFSFPVFTNLFFAQLNIWLLLSAGEFLRAWEQGRPFRGGLWLSGMLCKPQALALMLPFLILTREWDVLAGFALASGAIGAISLALAGLYGIKAWALLLIQYPGNLLSISPHAMMNIRMVGENLSFLLPPDVMRRIALGLSVVVALLALMFSICLRKRMPEEKSEALLLLLAATCAVVWHAHTHMAVILIPPLLSQVISGRMPRYLLVLWTVLPAAGFLVGGIINSLFILFGGKPFPTPLIGYSAFMLLGLHLYFVVWVALKHRHRLPERPLISKSHEQ